MNTERGCHSSMKNITSYCTLSCTFLQTCGGFRGQIWNGPSRSTLAEKRIPKMFLYWETVCSIHNHLTPTSPFLLTNFQKGSEGRNMVHASMWTQKPQAGQDWFLVLLCSESVTWKLQRNATQVEHCSLWALWHDATRESCHLPFGLTSAQNNHD